ncbi:MAG: hypothetical protein Q9226_003089 [Calogaya cf. arnoldii]
MPVPPPKPKIYTDNECTMCHEPLLESNSDSDPLKASYVIDDVQLRCDVARSDTFLSLMAQMESGDAEKSLKGEDGMGQGPLSPNVSHQNGGQTAMHMAAYNDDVEGVQLLLRYGADKHLKDEDGQTALDCAKDVNAEGVIALLKD